MKDCIWLDENLTRFTEDDFDRFLEWGFDQGASDILIESGQVLALTIHGAVYNVGRRGVLYSEIMDILRKIYQQAAPSLIKDTDIDFSYSILRNDNSLLRFRVNVTPCQGDNGSDEGVEIVARTIAGIPPDYKELGLEEEIIDACKYSSGLILVTGPTGSGKSTTIASMLRHICQTQPKHILAYEDPIEYDLKSVPDRVARVVQTEVRNHLEDFGKCVRNSLRRAPHIVFFGELRDLETIKGAIREALTGHLVFSTVHVTRVALTFSRMADEFAKEERKSITGKLVDSMRMIINQRLVRSLSGGRIAIKEYLIFTEEMRRHLEMCLLADKDITPIVSELVEKHGKPLLSDVKAKFKQGLLDISQYVLLITEIGKASDMDIAPEVALDMNAKGIIDESTYNAWMAEYSQFIEASESKREVAL